MSLPNYLAKIKSSGIYRFVWDKSQITATETETLRLVVGYSEKGPFNTPVYFDNPGDFKTTFGDVNKKLEKRGVFFHRLALQALKKGPILALNLKKFADETLNAVVAQGSGALTEAKPIAVEGVYDTSRFWSLNPDKLSALSVAPSDPAYGYYLGLAAVDSIAASNSVVMRGYAPTGYDVTIKSWYTTIGEDMPEYFIGYEDMLVSDFFAEIYVFKGQFTKALANSEELKRYFDVIDDEVCLKPSIKNAFGQDVDTLAALADNENSGFVQKYQGILLPNFKDTSGMYISLDLLFNQDVDKHKMMMHLNGDLLDDANITVKEVATRGWDKISVASLTKLISGQELDEAEKIAILGNKSITPKTAHLVWGGSDWMDINASNNADLLAYEMNTKATSKGTIQLGAEFAETGIKEGDRILAIDGKSELSVVTVSHVEIHSDANNVLVLSDNEASLPAINNASPRTYFEKPSLNVMNSDVNYGSVKAIIVPVTSGSGVSYKVKFNASVELAGYKFVGEYGEINPIEWGELYDITGGELTVHIKNSSDSEVASIALDFGAKTVSGECSVVVKCDRILSDTISTLAPMYIPGYVRNSAYVKPASNSVEDKLKWQHLILNAINPDSSIGYPGLVEALTNRKDVDYRYIVDTFESYIEPELKSVLSLIAKTKDNAVLLSNFPSIQTFIKSVAASFTDANGAFQMKYVKAGCNPQKAASTSFGLPSVENGASWCSFNTPVVITDGTLKNVVPVAALVSNNFMDKYASRQPYYIVAGPTYGKLTETGLIGPDYNFSRAELDILEPMGVNATVYVPRKGTFINSNQTAKQNPVTALSKINVRELVIYLQDQIGDLLQNYQWEFNTPTLRNLVKKKADTICENVQANNGLAVFSNQCDENNNTDDVINNEMLVLSTSIEPGMGCGKMVQELTIYKKGGMTSVIY